jgi:hypothetical protein
MRASGNNVIEIDVSPEDAAYLLKLSKGNRPLCQNDIDRYIGVINSGDWVRGNDTILISTDDVLINFHHRALAIIASGKTVPAILRINAEPREVLHIDTGNKRDPMDAPAFDPELNFLTEENVVIARACLTDGGSSYSNRDRSNKTIADWVRKYKPQIDKVIFDFFQGKDVKRLTQSVVKSAFLLALLNGKDEEALRYAARYLVNGAHSQDTRHGVKTLENMVHELDRGVVTSAGGSARKDTFQMTCIFLHRFLENWRDPNSQEIQKKPTWKKGQGFTAYKPSWFPCPDVKRVEKHNPVEKFYINMVAEGLKSGEVVSAADMAKLMIEAGYKGNSKNLERLVAKKFARMVKEANGLLDIGKATFEVAEDDLGKKRVSNYVFRRKAA